MYMTLVHVTSPRRRQIWSLGDAFLVAGMEMAVKRWSYLPEAIQQMTPTLV
jgi:hypothetical protein